MPTARRVLALVLSLAAMGSVRHAEAWRLEIDGPVSFDEDRPSGIAIDGAGDVVVAGQLGGPFPVFATVVKADGSTGAQLWRRDFAGTDTGTYGQSFGPVAADASGDVVVGGVLTNTTTREDFTVIKLAGADGTELWRQEVNGVAADDDSVLDLALDGAGNVVAAGYVNDGTDAFPYNVSTFFTVIKFAGANGMELWRRQVGAGSPFDAARHVAVDAAGDVIAVGNVGHFGDETLTLVKLAGADGTVQWSVSLVGDRPNGLALDGAGDVFVIGLSNYDQIAFGDLLVLKLANATGAVLWRRDIAGTAASLDGGSDLAIDGTGDPIIAGYVNNEGPQNDTSILKLDGATGADVWARDVVGGRGSADVVGHVAVDGAGDVLVGGSFSRQGELNLAVAKFAGATGAQLWEQELDGTTTYPEDDERAAVAVHPDGDVIAFGRLHNGGTPSQSGSPDFAVLKLGKIDGAVGPVAGRRLGVSDRVGNPAARRISAVARDIAIRVPAAGTAGDPTVNGATVTLRNPTTLESMTLSLPAGGSWQALGSPPGSRGYRYDDASGIDGPCRMLLAQPGFFRASCAGNLGPIPFTLDEPTQGSLVLSVQLGAAEPQCVRFGGMVRRDAGTGNPGPGGSFMATKAPAFSGDCP